MTDVQVATPTLAGPAARIALPFKAIWDTGASASVISASVAADLKLVPTGITQMETANGTKRDCLVYLVDILLPNNVPVQNLRVTEADIKCDVLIGMDIISNGDFSVTNTNGITTMSFRIPSIQEIDYVDEANTINLLGSGTRKERRAAVLAKRKAEKKGRVA